MTDQISLVVLIGVLALIAGGLISWLAFPQTITEIKTNTVEVPVEVPYEVIKEVPAPGILDQAVAAFMTAVANEEDEAGNEIDLQEGYDFDQISISRISDEYVVSYDDDKTTVEFEIRLKYDEKGDSERSEKITYRARVIYETDEDTTVEII